MEEENSFEKSEQKELIKKVGTLNKRLEILLKRDERKELTEIRRQLNQANNKQVISLDYVRSNRLEDIEEGIRETVQGMVYSKIAVCSSLANIVNKKLYRQVEAKSFFEYLKMERLPIKYKTAKEYAKIGDVIKRHGEELTRVSFQEEDGLKKLIYLDKALNHHESDKELVFHRIKEDSLRDFQRFADGDSFEFSEKCEDEDYPVEAMGMQLEISGRSIIMTRENYKKEAIVTIPDEHPFLSMSDEDFSHFMEEILFVFKKHLIE